MRLANELDICRRGVKIVMADRGILGRQKRFEGNRPSQSPTVANANFLAWR
jgi:hypothetical protein